jgi:hypothetical protein
LLGIVIPSETRNLALLGGGSKLKVG